MTTLDRLGVGLNTLALLLCCSVPLVQAQQSLTLLKQYDLGASRYSEGLDFHAGFLWHTSDNALYKLNTDGATDPDGDGDYDLPAEKTWNLTHLNHSESSVWFGDELFNFTFYDTTDSSSDAVFKLDLNDDETYVWQQVGVGLGGTNWGSCRDRSPPGAAIIYTAGFDNHLLWYEPESGNTTRTVTVTGLNWIEDLGMDRYGTVWASSFISTSRGLYRINPDTGEIIASYPGPNGLSIIDGIAIRSTGVHDVMYVTGKDTRYIWEYLVPAVDGEAPVTDLPVAAADLSPNFPNPFNPATTIGFSLPRAQEIRLCVYRLDGSRVSTLVDGRRGVGPHSVTWQGTDTSGRAVASGTYLYRLEAGDQVKSRPMVLVR